MRKILAAVILVLSLSCTGEESYWFDEYLDLDFPHYKLIDPKYYYCITYVSKLEKVEFPEISLFYCHMIVENNSRKKLFVQNIDIWRGPIIYSPQKEFLKEVNWWPREIVSEPVAGGDAPR